MKNIKLFIVLILTVIFIWYIQTWFKDYESMDNLQSQPSTSVNIGNFLAEYFYLMGLDFLDKKDFQTEKINDDIFIRKIPSHVKFRDDIYTSMTNSGLSKQIVLDSFAKFDNGQPTSSWVIIDKIHETFWNCMRPIIHSTISNAFAEENINPISNIPVIHFRCSDVPFERNPNYGFQKYKFFIDALNTIHKKANKKYGDVHISYCNTHLKNDNGTCDIYVDSLKQYLEKNGYRVNINCQSNIMDFATMFFSPAVISTSSSFSFMSGFFSNGIFISEGHTFTLGKETDQRSCGEDCKSWLFSGYTLKHSYVKDYYDTATVIKLLND